MAMRIGCNEHPSRLQIVLLLLVSLLLLAGCQASQLVVNQPLPKDAQSQPVYGNGYRFADLVRNSDQDILALLAFSGGGKRSAAFAHGALRGLRRIPVDDRGQQRTLLDEVSLISSVSGGSFPAAHYGLYHDRSFETFEADFLKRDIEAYIYGTFLLPWNWEWLVDPYYGTNDRMAEVYDRLMFHGATYKDLLARGLPIISVNATDIANGVSFPFTQPNFDLLCSNLNSFPVARAVAASNGFPVLFTPITLNSYRQECGPSRPPGVAAAPARDAEDLSRRAMLARTAQHYMDPHTTRYVHLMDGGIADNLALRGTLNALIGMDPRNEDARSFLLRTRRLLLISVDGEAAADPTLGQKRVVTGLGQIFSAVSGTQIDAYNFETLVLADDRIKRLVLQIKAARCEAAGSGRVMPDGTACDDVRGGLVHISLSGVADPAVREQLQAIPTGLTIPDADVDLLLYWGERLIVENPAIKDILSGPDSTGKENGPTAWDMGALRQAALPGKTQ